jgi:hypothetical protein
MDNISTTLVVALTENLQDQESLQKQERDLIAALRKNGVTWAVIADLYGVSRQAVHSKWSKVIAPEPEPNPVSPSWLVQDNDLVRDQSEVLVQLAKDVENKHVERYSPEAYDHYMEAG